MVEENSELSLKRIFEGYERIKSKVRRTPVIVNEELNEEYGKKFFFKAENLQVTGSFKVRGCLLAVSKLLERKNGVVKGVVTHSSGNHGQALAYAASQSRIPCVVVSPHTSPLSKQRAIKKYGGSLIHSETNPVDRNRLCQAVVAERGFEYISSCDNYDVITGQGSVGVEFLEQVPALDVILVPACGGGLAAGICVAVKEIKPDIKVFVVEPEGKDLEKSLRAGKRLWPNPEQPVSTIADGLRNQQLGHRNFPIIAEHAEKTVLTVDDIKISRAMKYALENLKILVEPAGAATIAAAGQLADSYPDLEHIGLIISGGNVDIDKLQEYFQMSP